MDLSSKDFTNYRIEEMDLELKADIKLIEDFTNAYELPFDVRSVEYTIGLFDEQDNVVGTGSFSGNILKYVLVDINHRESNAFAKITTHLINKVWKIIDIFMFIRFQDIFPYLKAMVLN